MESVLGMVGAISIGYVLVLLAMAIFLRQKEVVHHEERPWVKWYYLPEQGAAKEPIR